MYTKEILLHEQPAKLVAEGEASWHENNEGKQFGKYIDNLPWQDNRIDFNKIGRQFSKLNLNDASEKEITDFLNSSTVSDYGEVAFLYFDDAPMILATFGVVRERFLEFLTYSGDALLCGSNGSSQLAFHDFITVFAGHATCFLKK